MAQLQGRLHRLPPLNRCLLVGAQLALQVLQAGKDGCRAESWSDTVVFPCGLSCAGGAGGQRRTCTARRSVSTARSALSSRKRSAEASSLRPPDGLLQEGGVEGSMVWLTECGTACSGALCMNTVQAQVCIL